MKIRKENNRKLSSLFTILTLDNEDILREVTVKIRLERIDTQERVTVKVLLDSGAMELVMSLEFARKQRFKLKKNRKTDIYEKYRWF